MCELHFLDSDIERFYTTTVLDGSIFQMKRGTPKIKEDAIPSIFPSFPKYLNNSTKKRKLPTQRDSILLPKNRNTKALVINTEQDGTVLEELKDLLNYENLPSTSQKSRKLTKDILSKLIPYRKTLINIKINYYILVLKKIYLVVNFS